MAKLVLSALVAASALSAAMTTSLRSAVLPSGTNSIGSPNRYPDYQEARSVARETGKPLFVTFR